MLTSDEQIILMRQLGADATALSMRAEALVEIMSNKLMRSAVKDFSNRMQDLIDESGVMSSVFQTEEERDAEQAERLSAMDHERYVRQVVMGL